MSFRTYVLNRQEGNKLNPEPAKRLTICARGPAAVAGVDFVSEQEKPEARKCL